MNLVETILDKDGSAPQCGIQAGLVNESVVLDSDQDEGEEASPTTPMRQELRGETWTSGLSKYASREGARVSSRQQAVRGWGPRGMISLCLR